MLYIDKNQKIILIPKHANCSSPFNLTLKHNLTGTVYEFNNLTNSGEMNRNWIFTNCNFSNLQTGEYNYYLNDTECGLLAVVPMNDEPKIYDTEKTIIQYGN